MNYVIITPVKDEEKYIKNTLESVCGQTLLPVEWIIVNDGSKDKTREIILEFTEKYSWIKLVDKNSNNSRECGYKIVDAFYYGYNFLKTKNFNFIVKLDADLSLPKNYFEEIAKEFQMSKEVGMCGGYCVIEKNGKYVLETPVDYHLRGAMKSIRKECWNDIGGFKNVLGWDGLDEMTAMYKGWKTKVLDIPVVHHRPTSSAYNRFDLAVKHGVANYQNGGNIQLAIVRSIVRFFRENPIVGVGFFLGYFKALFGGYKKNVDKDLAKFINEFHTIRIFNAIKTKLRLK